jgi:hypothetical protein
MLHVLISLISNCLHLLFFAGNSDGHHSIIPIVVVKESEAANVSSIPPIG